MNVLLSEHIRSLRKSRSLTQEQLAEVLDVTAAAVSKWELGLSAPDIPLLMDMAEYFDVSVDMLLGYRIQSRKRERILTQLNHCIHDRNAEISWKEIEKILRRYPNDFEITYNCATLYALRATPSQDHRLNTRALALFEEACRLIGQNTNSEISLTSIQRDRAQIMRSLERKGEAAALLLDHNPCGVHNALIGEILAQDGKAEEAVPYLSRAMLECITKQMNIATGYMDVYMTEKRYRETIDAMHWIETVLNAAKRPETLCYTDKILTAYIAMRAYAHLLLGESDEARTHLKRARSLAVRFDESPSYAADAIRFVRVKRATAYDDYGDTAMDGIDRLVREQNDAAFLALWQEVCHAKD